MRIPCHVLLDLRCGAPMMESPSSGQAVAAAPLGATGHPRQCAVGPTARCGTGVMTDGKSDVT